MVTNNQATIYYIYYFFISLQKRLIEKTIKKLYNRADMKKKGAILK